MASDRVCGHVAAMKRLILVRHAKTERRSESGEDFDRALTPEGRSAATRLAEMLAGAGLIPDRALVSPALRTRQTFDLLKPHLPDVHEESAPALYEASADGLRRAAEQAAGEAVMLVAHNPGVHALALALAGEAAAIGVDDRLALEAGFPTGSAAAFEFLDGRIGCLGVFRPETIA
jgi:phosphohistidine phosphatase